MKLLHAYLDGWRVFLRVLAFSLCLGLFALPVVLAVHMYSWTHGGLLANTLLGCALLIAIPMAGYLASWYTGEFRAASSEEEETQDNYASADDEF